MKYEGKYNILRVYLSEVSGKETLYDHFYVTYTGYRLQMNIRWLRKKGSECKAERGGCTIKVRTLKQYKHKCPPCTCATVKSRQEVNQKIIFL